MIGGKEVAGGRGALSVFGDPLEWESSQMLPSPCGGVSNHVREFSISAFLFSYQRLPRFIFEPLVLL